MKTYFKLKIRFRFIQAACLILCLLAAQGCAIKNDLSFSRVDPSMGQRVQKELDAAVAEYNVPGAVLALGDMNGLIGHGGSINNFYTSFVGRYHGYDCVILVNGQAGDSEEKTFRAKAVLEKVIKGAGL